MNGAKGLNELSREGRLEELADLLAEGVDVDEKDRGSYTPLHWAVQEGHIEIARLLLQHGADIDSTEENGFTPLLLAVGEGNTRLVSLLVERGADVNVQRQSGSHDTPLHLACAWNRRDIVNILIEHGADLEARDDDGRTPIFFAAMYGHTELVQQLIANGARADVIDRVGKSMMDLARSGPDDVKIIQGAGYQVHIDLPIEGLDSQSGSADVAVILDSGQSYAVSFFTPDTVPQEFKGNRHVGEYKEGLYFLAPGVILTELLTEDVISGTIADLISRDEAESALRKISDD